MRWAGIAWDVYPAVDGVIAYTKVFTSLTTDYQRPSISTISSSSGAIGVVATPEAKIVMGTYPSHFKLLFKMVMLR